MATSTRRKRKTPSSTTDRATLYALAVVAGDIVAGPHVRNACRRHLDDLEHGAKRGLRYDEAIAAHVIAFFETKLCLSEGQFEGQPLKLEPSQAFIIGSIFGWQRETRRYGWRRRFRRAYIEQGKGNGKSPIAGGIGLYGMTADKEAGAEIYAAGATKTQAGILFRDAVKMVDKSPELDKRIRRSGGPGREYNLAVLRTNSNFQPISRETKKTGSGPRPHFALCDEVHEHPDRGIMEMLERGFKFRTQPLLFMITNSGSDRKSVAWEEHEHAVKVAAGNHDAKDEDAAYLGKPIDDSTFSYVCALDPGDDPLEDPSCWIKANPLLGVTIDDEYLAGVVKQAKDMPGKLNGILRLHFCVWTDAETAWMSRAALEPCLADFDDADHVDAKAWIGLDLSRNRDITALACVVKTGEVEVEAERDGEKQIVLKPTFDAWIEAWTPGDTVAARALVDKQPYQEWIDARHLHAPKGASIRFDHVAQALAEYTHDFDVQAVAYDRYAFKASFEPECAKLGIAVEFVEHPQGGTKKGKPTEAMKAVAEMEGREPEGLWMPGSVRLLEDAILERRIRLKTNPVLISAMMSAVTDEDKWGNHWLAKERAVNKIDAAVALAMAIGAASSMAASDASAASPWDDPNFNMAGAA
ncbi:terminase large subunit [Rhizorhabdus histidinilytica]|uniref:terminase large subunit n=1 Tax=Rhizorhabdus histidinilytica TaxID=439228 RepID=UPI00321F889F